MSKITMIVAAVVVGCAQVAFGLQLTDVNWHYTESNYVGYGGGQAYTSHAIAGDFARVDANVDSGMGASGPGSFGPDSASATLYSDPFTLHAGDAVSWGCGPMTMKGYVGSVGNSFSIGPDGNTQGWSGDVIVPATCQWTISMSAGASVPESHYPSYASAETRLEVFRVLPNQWNLPGGGTWNSTANWTGAIVPQLPGDYAGFLATATTAATVTITSPVSLAEIEFDNASKYTIAGSAGITLDGGSFASSGTIRLTSGSHEIAAPVSLNGNAMVLGTGSLLVSGAVSGTGALTQTGPGMLTLGGSNSYSGGTTISAGTLSISSNANIGGATSTINFNGGILQVTGTTLTNLNSHSVNWNALRY
jgi:autotransporter-associated beta strand protein